MAMAAGHPVSSSLSVLPMILSIGLVTVLMVVALLVRVLNRHCQRLEGARAAGGAWRMEEAGALMLSVVVPAYNEEERLPMHLEETIGYLKRRVARGGSPAFTWEVIVVDDGSQDKTADVVRDFARKGAESGGTVKLMPLAVNCGKGCAVRSGVEAARGRYILMADADGATRISDLEKLEDKLELLTGDVNHTGEMAGVVVGSRAHLQQDAAAERKWYRTVLMHGFHALVWMVIGDKIRDTQCGFKLFSRKAARMVFANQRLRRWCFDVELIFLSNMLKIPIAEVSVNWTEVPGSKLRILSTVHMAWELGLILIGYRLFGTWKINLPLSKPAR